MFKIPRVMIAGTHSGVGKTTMATAIMTMLNQAGFKVQPYKVGPDYIDPGLHQIATGRISRNLDTFLVGAAGVQELFVKSAQDADIAVIEGVMGLYDGIGSGNQGSSAHVADLLQCPVLLVLDARSMAHSAAAVVWGYAQLPGGVPIAGVILNQVGSPRHYQILKEAIESKTGIPVLGALHRNEFLQMPARYLGLVPRGENNTLTDTIKAWGKQVSNAISKEQLLKIATSAPAITAAKNIFNVEPIASVRIGLLRDQSFNFYYQDGLDVLTAMGAQLIPVSPLTDPALPADLDGLYIGGGFPELYMQQLAENKSFQRHLKQLVQQNIPLYAEGGGLMYLCAGISDTDGNYYPSLDIVPTRCQMHQKRIALGYVDATALTDHLLANRGEVLKGHVFHYSSVDQSSLNPAFSLQKTTATAKQIDGHVGTNLLATYVHFHFAGATMAAARFIKACAKFQQARKEMNS